MVMNAQVRRHIRGCLSSLSLLAYHESSRYSLASSPAHLLPGRRSIQGAGCPRLMAIRLSAAGGLGQINGREELVAEGAAPHAKLTDLTPCSQRQIGPLRRSATAGNGAGRGRCGVVRGRPLGTGQDRCERHGSGTAGTGWLVAEALLHPDETRDSGWHFHVVADAGRSTLRTATRSSPWAASPTTGSSRRSCRKRHPHLPAHRHRRVHAVVGCCPAAAVDRTFATPI